MNFMGILNQPAQKLQTVDSSVGLLQIKPEVQVLESQIVCKAGDQLWSAKHPSQAELTTKNLILSVTDAASTPSDYRSFVCNLCNKAYKWKKDLQRHSRLVHQLSDSRCKQAAEQTWQIKQLPQPGDELRSKAMILSVTQTTSTPSDFRPFACGLCGKAYKWKKDLQRHNRRVHGQSQIQQKPEDHQQPQQQSWPLKLPPQGQLIDKNHIPSAASATTTTTTEASTSPADFRPFVCELCSKSYKWNKDLQRHTRLVHERKSPAGLKLRSSLSTTFHPDLSTR
ncbi:hypothetical protein AAHC03_020920 [Spirometra sp. Aus1]